MISSGCSKTLICRTCATTRSSKRSGRAFASAKSGFSSVSFFLDLSSPAMNVTVNGRTRHYRTVSFNARHNRVVLIEQRLLPHRFKLVESPDFRATARAIRDMIVRGAGAIGATAAYGLAQGARAFKGRGIPA